MAYKRLNVTPIAIERVEDENDENLDFVPSFWWNNRRYYLDDFVQVHNNPWVSDDFPVYIWGMEANEFSRPLFIGFPYASYTETYVDVYECDV